MARIGDGPPGTQAYPPFAAPSSRARAMPPIREGAADPPPDDDYPAIEQFLDELPLIDDYLEGSESAGVTGSPIATGNPVNHGGAARDIDDEGWAVSEWQSYDWSKLSLLGRSTREGLEAEASWIETDWATGNAGRPSNVGFAGESGHGSMTAPGAAEVAAALDDIAGRIRSGELSIDHFRGTPPEAAMAAALAALLRMRG